MRLTTQKTVRILQIKFLLKFNANTSLLDQIKTVSCSEAKKEIRGHSMYAFLISEQNYKTTVSIDGGLQTNFKGKLLKRNPMGQ